jgi:hypothetical protein
VTSAPRGLSEQDLIDRANFFGGSNANTLMNGTPQEIADDIAVKRGERKRKDLSRVLQVQMGVWTEEDNCDWFTLMTGRPVTNRPVNGQAERRHHFLYEWMANTLDGMTTVGDGMDAIFEAKHTSERNDMETMVDRYYPQLQHSMFVSSLSWSVLSVFFGNSRWAYAEVPFDQAYSDRMIERIKLYWHCRLTGERWPELPPPPRPDIAHVLEVSAPRDMGRNNRWCELAARWRRLKPVVTELKQVTDELCAMVDKETKKTFGAGVTATVSKTGSVTIKVDPDWNPIDDIAANDDDELTY